MGLLEKSTRLREAGPAPSGLLRRALSLHDSGLPASPPHDDEPSPPRADRPRADRPHGLLAKATLLHDQESDLISDAELEAGLGLETIPSPELDEAAAAYDELMGPDDRSLLFKAERMRSQAEGLPDEFTDEFEGEQIPEPAAGGGGLLARAEKYHIDADSETELEAGADLDAFPAADGEPLPSDELLPAFDFNEPEAIHPEADLPAHPTGLLARASEYAAHAAPGEPADAPERADSGALEEDLSFLDEMPDMAGSFDEPVQFDEPDSEFEPLPEQHHEPDLETSAALDLDVPVDLEAAGPDLFEEHVEPVEPGSTAPSDAEEPFDLFEEHAPDSPSSDALPAWEYDGPGSPEDDPFTHPAKSEDKLFEDWEDEAEFEAERGIKELEGRPVQEEAPGDILLAADSEFTTVPDEVHIASQKKIDNYLSLFDITKEISTIDDFDNLWDAILYAAMGQVGAETICIFSTTRRNGGDHVFEPVAHSGFALPEGWTLRPGDRIYDTLTGKPEIKYAQEFLNGRVAGQERNILETTRASIVVPLKNQERVYGILLLGAQISGDEYGLDDLEFLNLLGEISAVGVDRVLSRLEYEKDTSDLKRRTAVHKKIFELSRQASAARNVDEIYDSLMAHLVEDFQVESFSVVLLSAPDQEYRIFAGNQISPASIEKFRLGVSSDLVGMISNLTHVYELTDFRENSEITRNYTNDDLGLMQTYWIVPLINLNWLVGFLTIHKTSRSWNDFQREMLVTLAEMLAPVFANSIILGERETIFRDPFSPLESRLRVELKKASEFQAPVCLVEIRVKNIKRLLSLNPPDRVSEFLTVLGRSIAGFLFETDFQARIGQGRFALILPGRGREEAEIFVKKLRTEFKRVGMLPGSPIDVQYVHQIIVAPHDTDDPEKILSMLD